MNWKFEDERIYGSDEKGELMAEVTFAAKENGEANIDHTYVNPVLRGRGIAGELMEVAAGHFREKGLKATASCSFANAWLKKNRDVYADILSSDFDADAAACKIDGKR